MKAKDLRLGNFVQYDGYPMNVTGIYHNCVYLDFEGNEGDFFELSDEDLKGIELTEYWLNKFGFEFSVYFQWWYKNNFHNYTIDLGGSSEFECNGHPIKYVHELQNLHFALTGQELEVQNG